MIGSYFMTVRFFDLRPDHCLEAHMMNQIQDDVDFFIILSMITTALSFLSFESSNFGHEGKVLRFYN